MHTRGKQMKEFEKNMAEWSRNLSSLLSGTAFKQLSEATKKIQKTFNQCYKIIEQFNKRTEKIYNKTAKYQWFYNRAILLDNKKSYDEKLLSCKHKREFDKIMIEAYETILPQIFKYLKSLEPDIKIRKALNEITKLYVNKMYFSCIASCQPIIENLITRLNNGSRITSSKAIRELIETKFLEDEQTLDLLNNRIYELFNKYYYCDDKAYDNKAEIPNRHFIAHGFNFKFVNQKGALNMIILISILYQYLDFNASVINS